MDHYDAWFSWNHAKNRENMRKHGTSFFEAVGIWDGPTVSVRTHHGRTLSVGVISGEYWTVVWTPEGTLRRIISARRSTESERRNYDRRNNG